MRTCTFLFLAMIETAAIAGSRTSASYSVAAEITDTAGRRTTSASYTVDASVGGVVGVSTAATPATMAKAGFAGQLFDVTGLTLTSAAPSVNENATVQLGAWQSLDDTSVLAVNASAVGWSVLSGPVSGVASGGLATAATVYQDTPVTVHGSFGGFNGSLMLTVLNVNTDDFGTYAGDGIDDAWQVQYFGLNNPLAAPAADASHTGQSNLLKYAAGLNPTDPTSRFVVDAQAVPGQPAQRKVVISPRFTDRTYIVEGSNDFTSWSAVSGTIVDNGTVRTITDPAAGVKKFYRVRIVKP